MVKLRQARIYTRCNGGKECPACRREISELIYSDMLVRRKQNREEARLLMKKAVVNYLCTEKISFVEDYDNDIGIPISIFIPDKKLAIEFSTLRDNRTKELVKNHICKRLGITMIRILDPDVKKYDNCFCFTRKNRDEETVEHIMRKANYICGYPHFYNI